MTKSDFTKYKLPNTPGVYFFLGTRRQILYIGKATSLASRVKSYFDINIKEKRSALIEKMVAEAKKVEWMETDSVLEAMLLETNLIRTHKPVYNTISKDDKSYNHVVITREEYPRVLVVRGKDLLEINDTTYSKVYGPFPSGMLFKEALKIIRKLFQFYDKDASLDTRGSKMRKGKLDFNTQIGLYPDSLSKQEYARTIKHICLFFEGKKEKIVADLTKQMHLHAKRQEFESAHTLKKKIFALQHIQDVALIKDDARVYRDDKTFRIEAYDIAHMAGKDMVGVMTVLERGEPAKNEYRKFTIQGYTASNDTGALKEVLTRRMAHTEWQYPDLIVVDGSTAQKNVAESVLKAHKRVIPVVGVVKNDKHKPERIIGAKKHIEQYKLHILHANAEAHRFAISFHRKKRSKRALDT